MSDQTNADSPVCRGLKDDLARILAPIAEEPRHILSHIVNELRSGGAGRYRNAIGEMLARGLDHLEGRDA